MATYTIKRTSSTGQQGGGWSSPTPTYTTNSLGKSIQNEPWVNTSVNPVPNPVASNSSKQQLYTNSDGSRSVISPEARIQAQSLLPTLAQQSNPQSFAIAQQNYQTGLNNLQQQYSNQQLTPQAYNQNFNQLAPLQQQISNPTPLNVNTATLQNNQLKTTTPNTAQLTQVPSSTLNSLGKTIQNEPWVNTNINQTSVNNQIPNEPWISANNTQITSPTNVSATNQSNITSAKQTSATQVKPQKFYDGTNVVDLTDENRQELFNRTYGNQTNISGKITRLSNNGQTQDTGSWKPTSPQELQARQALYNTGGLGTTEEWNTLMKENPQAGQDAWAWWINDPRLRSDGGINIKEVQPVGTETDTLKDIYSSPVDPNAPQIGLNSPETKNVLSETDNLVNSYKNELGINTGTNGLDWLEQAWKSLDKKIEAIGEQTQVEVKSAKEQIMLNSARKDELAKEFALDRNTIIDMFNNQDENLRQQKIDLDNQTRKQREAELGAIAVSQAMRGVSLATTSYARQEMSNMADNLNREYSIANDRLNLQQREIRTATADKINQLEKNKADILFKYETKIQDLQYKMDMALPKSKEVIADLKYKSVQELQNIEAEQQNYKMKEQEYLIKLQDNQLKLQGDKFNKALLASQTFGQAVGLSQFGIADGTPIYNKTKDTFAGQGANLNTKEGIDATFNNLLTFAGTNNKIKGIVQNAYSKLNSVNNNVNIPNNIKELEKSRILEDTVINMYSGIDTQTYRGMLGAKDAFSQKQSVNNALVNFKNDLKNIFPYQDENKLLNETWGNAKTILQARIDPNTNLFDRAIASGMSIWDKNDVEVANALGKLYNTLQPIFSKERLALYGTALTGIESALASQSMPLGMQNSFNGIATNLNNFYNQASSSYNNKISSITGNYDIDYANNRAILQNINNTKQSFNQTENVSKLSPISPNKLTSNSTNTEAKKTFESKYLSDSLTSKVGNFLLPNAKAENINNEDIINKLSNIPNGENSGMWCGSFVNKTLNLPSGKRFGDSLQQKLSIANIKPKNLQMSDLNNGMVFVSNPYPNIKLDNGKIIGHVGFIENIGLDGKVTITDSNYNGDRKIRKVTYNSLQDFINNEKVEGFYNPYK